MLSWKIIVTLNVNLIQIHLGKSTASWSNGQKPLPKKILNSSWLNWRQIMRIGGLFLASDFTSRMCDCDVCFYAHAYAV